MRTLAIVALGAALGAGLVHATAHACACESIDDPASELARAERWPIVVDAEVVRTERVRRRPRGMQFLRAEVRIRRSLRGAAPGTVIVYRLLPDSCPAVSLEVGSRYLLLLRPDNYSYADRFPEPSDAPRFALPGCNPSVVWRDGDPFERAFDAALSRR